MFCAHAVSRYVLNRGSPSSNPVTVDIVIVCGRPTNGQMSPTDKILGTDCSVMLMDREPMVTSGQLFNVECGPVFLDESD